MDPQPNPTHAPSPSPVDEALIPEASSKKPKKSRIYLIFFLFVLLLIIGGAILLLSHHTKPVSKITQQSNTSTTAPTQTTSQTPANTWKATVDAKALPLGDGHVSASPQVGYIDSCTTTFNGRGAANIGSWVNDFNNTWNSQSKIHVEGSVSWPNATYSVTTSGSSRVINTNDLPENEVTGNFPIASTDPAYQYDRNPNSIAAQNLSYTLPLNPVAATSPNCTGLGVIGILEDGVVLYNGLDAAGRDAVAHEVQDSCDGHPDQSKEYHYHDISSCLLAKATGPSTLVGYAADGYGIYVERDSEGNMPTNADLDACHGRTSQVMWNGTLTTLYHYDATLEYPYTIGCFHGTPINTHGTTGNRPGA